MYSTSHEISYVHVVLLQSEFHTCGISHSVSYRIAIFQFVIDNKIEEPIVEFISEDPYLQYVSTGYLILITKAWTTVLVGRSPTSTKNRRLGVKPIPIFCCKKNLQSMHTDHMQLAEICAWANEVLYYRSLKCCVNKYYVTVGTKPGIDLTSRLSWRLGSAQLVLYYDVVHVQNFRVTGKCVGQFSSECTQYYAEKVWLY